MKQYNRSHHGFTILEIMIVIVIIGLMATFVGPSVMKQFGAAKSKTARIQIEDLSAALDLYYLENSRYPTSSEGLKALIENPGDTATWNGPYLKKKKVPLDPWQREYSYTAPGDNAAYEITSLGADNSPGGEGENADINSWE